MALKIITDTATNRKSDCNSRPTVLTGDTEASSLGEMEPSDPEPRKIILWIVMGLIAWGTFHAVGAYRYNQNALRGFVVLACFGGFLGFWMLMLALRKRRIQRAKR